MDGERSSQQQFKDELHDIFKTMTDPEEQEKEALRKRRARTKELAASDTGL
jgi:hypothetical protein